MKFFLVTVSTLALTLLELLAGNRLPPMFFPLYGAVYFAVAYRKRSGIISAIASGVLLDVLYARSITLLGVLFPLIVLLALPVVKRFRRQLPAAAFCAGGVCGTAGALVVFLLTLIYGTPFPGPDLFSMVIFQGFAGAVFMLVFTSLADVLAFKCNLPRFSIPGCTGGRRHDHE